MKDPGIVLQAEQYLVKGHFLHDGGTFIKNVDPEPKLHCSNCIPSMGSLEIFTNLTNRDIKVQVFMGMEGSGEQMNEQAVGRIFLRHQLNLHRPKLNSPANCIVDGDFQPYRIPIGTIKHLEYGVFIIAHCLGLLMYDEDIPVEDICDMLYEIIVNFYV